MVACIFPVPSGGRYPLEMKKNAFPRNLCHVVSEYIWLRWSNSRILGAVACFFLHLQEGGALWNEVYLLKFLMLCSFRIHMVMAVYLQNPRSGFFFFPAPSGGRCPLKMNYTYPSSLCHVVSEYIWLGWPISKTLGVLACYFQHLKEHLEEGSTLWKLNMLTQIPHVM